MNYYKPEMDMETINEAICAAMDVLGDNSDELFEILQLTLDKYYDYPQYSHNM